MPVLLAIQWLLRLARAPVSATALGPGLSLTPRGGTISASLDASWRRRG
jgi:hypothetical protein